MIIDSIFEIHHITKNQLRQLHNLADLMLEDDMRTINRFLAIKGEAEKLISKVDKKISEILKHDLRIISDCYNEMSTIVERIMSNIWDFRDLQAHTADINRLKGLQSTFKEILKRDEYIEHLVKETLLDIRMLWEQNIRNKRLWLYHGTSILFLPHIQKNGLDTNSLPKGMERALSQLAKLGLIPYVREDKSRTGTIFCSWDENVIKAAAAPSLPAIIYEHLDPRVMQKSVNFKEKYSSLSQEEKKMLQVIFRYGANIMRNNRVIVIRILLDSDLLKYLSFPDYLSDYNIFYDNVIKRIRLFTNLGKRAESIRYYCSHPAPIFMTLTNSDTFEVRLRKPIPPKFLYLEVLAPTGYQIIKIENWNETTLPKVI